MSEVNYVRIFISTKALKFKQNEEEIDVFVKQVEKLALATLSYSSTEITIEKHRRIRQIEGAT